MTKAPMIDFSVVSRNGVAALAGDQYIVSVAHNGGYNNVDFGAEGSNPDQHRFSYQIVKRNNYKAGTNGFILMAAIIICRVCTNLSQMQNLLR